MKARLIRWFDRTFGVLFRIIQMTLPLRTASGPGVQDLVGLHAIEDSADFAIQNLSHALMFQSREDLWAYCVRRNSSLRSESPVIAEFGVCEGDSINALARMCPRAQIFGFDSFEGLEEDWHGFIWPKGSMSTHGKIPEVEPNVKLHKGWFEETVPDFVTALNNRQIQLLHMDADTYKPTIYVLRSLASNLRAGSIIIFDEFFGYPNFRLHEFRAWHEFVAEYGVEYHYLCYTGQGVAVEIQ